MIRIVVKLDIEQDAWNWWHACNRVSHGIDWKQRIEVDMWSMIVNRSKEEAFEFLIPYLTEYYEKHSQELHKVLQEAQNIFGRAEEPFKLMEMVTKFPLYRSNYTVYLTTFPRCPYSYETGAVWLCALWPTKCYLGTFLHELLHFQFIHYYKYLQGVNNLSPNRFEYLKESLTIILNSEFRNYMCQYDNGYEPHQELRKRLAAFWNTNKDFNALVTYGVSQLTQSL